MVRPPRRDRDRSGSSQSKIGNQRLFAGIIIGVAISLLLPGIAVGSVAHVEDSILAPPPSERIQGDDTLKLRVEDTAYMSRIYREADHEVAYCGLLTNDEPPRLEIWLADTVSAGPDFIEFITNNCPGKVQEILLHTHPSGSISLSERDKQTLAIHSANVMCVQGGQLPTEPGSSVDNLACYEDLQPDSSGVTLRRIGVTTVRSDALIE